VKFLLEDRFGVDGFELALEVAENLSAAVGPTTLVGEVVRVVLRLFAIASPGRS